MAQEENGPSVKGILRAEGKRVTAQRSLLFRIIQESHGHLDAHEIYQQARQHDPRISLSTVYRTIGLLKGLHLVEELHLDEEHHHYESTPDRTHYHLVCSHCGRVVEFDTPLVGELWAELERAHGFRLARIQIEGAGRCPECQLQEASAL